MVISNGHQHALNELVIDQTNWMQQNQGTDMDFKAYHLW